MMVILFCESACLNLRLNGADLAIVGFKLCLGGNNHKKLYRLYREECLVVKRRKGRKRALETRRPMLVPDKPNQRWSLDFVGDALTDSRRIRVLCVVDDHTLEALATIVDTSISGFRVGREL